ncbi:radical SAM protein [Methanosphaera sp. ISO3-F5]|uniref:SPL family radical SAM protein n=1 Tax=Methanosphaera sp. ISO3-F5 TaxID=1452353 RepID=UPI002B25EB4D|nr:radical SAM protein [Methanosphaera sp. ISO3-F5]WQH63593.1 radical SAM protein [Methanosphaera sp. ISO3-F5]
MHYITAKTILSAKNGMNIYRGCTHGCIYCDSRSKVYNMNHPFEDVAVKKNSHELLRKALHNKKERCMIGLGSMSDPYIPLEKNIEYTRKTLELAYNYGHGFTCITKSDLILRDIELLKKINQNTKAVVQVTLTCTDDKISKIIEPNVSTTNERIKVLQKLDQENIPTIVWLTPVLPYITDTEENITGILDACISNNVKGVICFEMGLTLREGNREYYYENLEKHFPGLKKVYQEKYGENYSLQSPYNKKLMKIFYEKTQKAGLMNNPEEIFKYLNTLPRKIKTRQSTLF